MARIDPKTLILAVIPEEALWNKKSNEFYNSNVKWKCWLKVVQQVVNDYNTLSKSQQLIELEAVKKRWKAIRGNYRKKLQKSPIMNLHSYPYSKLLEFLLPTMEFLNEETKCHIRAIGETENDVLIVFNDPKTNRIWSDYYSDDAKVSCNKSPTNCDDSNNNNAQTEVCAAENQSSSVSRLVSVSLDNNRPQIILNSVRPQITSNTCYSPQESPPQNTVPRKIAPSQKIIPMMPEVSSAVPLCFNTTSSSSILRSQLINVNSMPYCIIPVSATHSTINQNVSIPQITLPINTVNTMNTVNTIQTQPPVILGYTQANTQPSFFPNIQHNNIQPIINPVVNGFWSTFNTCPITANTQSSVNRAKSIENNNFVITTGTPEKQTSSYMYAEPQENNNAGLFINIPTQNESHLFSLKETPTPNSPTTITLLNNMVPQPQIIGIDNSPYNKSLYTLKSQSIPEPQITLSLTNTITTEPEYTHAFKQSSPYLSPTNLSPVNSRLFSTEVDEPVILTFNDLL